MQNVYFNEIEAAYTRRRVQDAVAASDRAAQAVPPRTRCGRPIFPNMVLACRRAREVFQRQRPVIQTIPSGRELPAA